MLILQYKTGVPPIGSATTFWDPSNYTSYNSYQVAEPGAAPTYGTLAEAYSAGIQNVGREEYNNLIFVDNSPPSGLFDLYYNCAVPTHGQWAIDGTGETGSPSDCNAWLTRGDTAQDGRIYFYNGGSLSTSHPYILWDSVSSSCYTQHPACFVQSVSNFTCYSQCGGFFPVTRRTLKPLVIRVLS